MYLVFKNAITKASFECGERWCVALRDGHGTAVFSDAALASLAAAAARVPAGTDAAAALSELEALTEAINPAVGDALSGILVVEAVLRSKGWGLPEWDAMYSDLPSRQVKVQAGAVRRPFVTQNVYS